MKQSLGGSSLAAFVSALDSIGWSEPEDVGDATYYLIAAVAVHSYDRPDLAVAIARKTVAEMGWGVPVYMTETGHSGDGQVQAEMVAKRIALCAQVNTGVCVIYRAQDQPDAGDGHFGLIRADGTPKPAFSTLTGVLSTGDAP